MLPFHNITIMYIIVYVYVYISHLGHCHINITSKIYSVFENDFTMGHMHDIYGTVIFTNTLYNAQYMYITKLHIILVPI